MSEEIRVLKEILDNADLDNYTIDDDECYLNGYARKCLKKVLEEIERLTVLCNRYEEEHNTTFKIWEKDLKNFEHEKNRELKVRIDKAIEYIKTHKYPTMYGFSNDDLDKNDLIKILQGSEK